MKRIIFTVTNDLAYDQRMMRICTSLAAAGYHVTLIGTGRGSAAALPLKKYRQIRLVNWFKKGPGFYIEYNCRLFCRLLFVKADLLCSIDLDTIIPVWMVSVLKNKKRVYDAHEYFSQQKEIVTRPAIYRIWHWIEKKFVPLFPKGYTVGKRIAEEFYRLYSVRYSVIRNVPLLQADTIITAQTEKYILYQGAVNEGRGLEYLIPAMKQVQAKLLIFGDGNFISQIKNSIQSNNLTNKVFLKGKLPPEELKMVTAKALIGINLVENTGLNQYFSLANKFFDYMHHLVPQVTMAYPEYKDINEQIEIALLLQNTEPDEIANSLNLLLDNKALYEKLRHNCVFARQQFNWQLEEKTLLLFYQNIFL